MNVDADDMEQAIAIVNRFSSGYKRFLLANDAIRS